MVAREVLVADVAEVARQIRPDIAVVGLHDHHTAHALGLIGEVVRGGICPVIAALDGEDPGFIAEAARAGIFAYITSLDPEALRGALDIATRRFRQAQEQTDQLEGAIGRRAVIERAKGVLMERYSIDDTAAFEMIRDHARKSGQKVVDVSDALLRPHSLLRDQAG